MFFPVLANGAVFSLKMRGQHYLRLAAWQYPVLGFYCGVFSGKASIAADGSSCSWIFKGVFLGGGFCIS